MFFTFNESIPIIMKNENIMAIIAKIFVFILFFDFYFLDNPKFFHNIY